MASTGTSGPTSPFSSCPRASCGPHRSALVSTTTGSTPASRARAMKRSSRRGLKSASSPITNSAVSTLLTMTVRVTLSRPS